MSAAGAVEARAWCTFRLDDGHYGLELARVEEVLRPLPVTRLPYPALPPGARSRGIAGLMNLRGRIVPVVDLRVVLGRDAARAAGTGAGLVVVRSVEGPVALLVDAIGDVRRADSLEPLRASPAASPELPDDGGSLVAGTLAFPGELLVVLDLDRVLACAFGALERERP
jgi:purine-binding chemotaxis protein CheW